MKDDRRDGGAATETAPGAAGKAKKGAGPPAVPEGETALRALHALMNGSGSDQVRVAAAKTLLERASQREERAMKNKTENDILRKQRKQALDAIAKLLDELAAAKSAGGGSPVKMDQAGAAGAADSGGAPKGRPAQ